MPNDVCSNQSVTQQWAGTVPHRTRMAAINRTVAQVGGADRPALSRHPRPPYDHQPHEKPHVQHIHPRQPDAVLELEVRRNGADRQQADQQPRRLATEHRQPDRFRNQRPGIREPSHLVPRRGQGSQEMQQGDGRHQRRAELIQNEHLAAEDVRLEARAADGIGIDADVIIQPGQKRENKSDAGEDQAHPCRTIGLTDLADPERPDQRGRNREFEPGHFQEPHENSSIVPKWSLCSSDSRDDSPARKSVHRRSIVSNHRKSCTIGAAT